MDALKWYASLSWDHFYFESAVTTKWWIQRETAEIRFLRCGQLDFESESTAQNDEFKVVLVAQIHARKRRDLAKKLNT